MKFSIKDFLIKVARAVQWLLTSIQKNFKVMKKSTKRIKYKEIIRKCVCLQNTFRKIEKWSKVGQNQENFVLFCIICEHKCKNSRRRDWELGCAPTKLWDVPNIS